MRKTAPPKRLKTHTYNSNSAIRTIQKAFKPTCLCTKSGTCPFTKSSKVLKTHAYSNKFCSQEGAQARSLWGSQPQRWWGMSLTHPHSFASPARTNRNRNRFPGSGGQPQGRTHSPYRQPKNMHMNMSRIPFFICIFMNVFRNVFISGASYQCS